MDYTVTLDEHHSEAYMLARECPAALDNMIIHLFAAGKLRECDIYMFHSDREWVVWPGRHDFGIHKYPGEVDSGYALARLGCHAIKTLPDLSKPSETPKQTYLFPRSRGKGNVIIVSTTMFGSASLAECSKITSA